MNRIYQGKVTAVEIPDGKEEHNQMAAKRLRRPSAASRNQSK